MLRHTIFNVSCIIIDIKTMYSKKPMSDKFDAPEYAECNYCNTLHVIECLSKCILCLEDVCLECRCPEEISICESCDYILERYQEHIDK